MTASLYLHIPFCRGACDYCDFYSVSFPASGELLDRYIDLLIEDVRGKLTRFEITLVPTLFVGGGTPSILGPQGLLRLFSSLRTILPSWPDEVSVEANPESVNRDMLLALCDAGLGPNDRLSIGIQSLDPVSRQAVGRLGTAEDALRSLDLARSHFPGRVSADLIAGLPFQTEGRLLADIESVLSFGLRHISLYSLSLEPGTTLFDRATRDGANLPEEDESDCLWIAGRDLLDSHGIAQYEVSNFAFPGEECRHNLRYWNMESWLGAGPAASGTIVDEALCLARRYTREPDVEGYCAGKGVDRVEELDRNTLMTESLMMGFRLRSGPDAARFVQRFGCRIEDCIGATLDAWRHRGLIEAGRLALTREGLLLLDPFLIDCLSELETTKGLPI